MVGIVGQSVERQDSRDKVLGSALYPGDFNRPGQAYMKMLFADRPHAIIRSIDTSGAEAMPGVLGVFTARDTGHNAWGLLEADQPVLCGPGSEAPYADRVRFIGDQVALVVAETEEIAAEGVRRIVVDYEDLPVLMNPEAAMQPDAPLIHPERGSNVLARFRIRFGDPEVGFAQAAVVVEAEYHTPVQEHAYLQPDAGLAYLDEQGRITMIVGGQGAHEDANLTAAALGVPREKVRVIYPAIGGGFGGRGYPSVQIALGLAVWKLHQRGIDRPVKIVWSRPETFRGHCKRHPFVIRARWGADRHGKLTAVEQTMIAASGPYFTISDRVLANALQTCTGLYYVPNVKVDAYAVYTNHITGGAFRGFGSYQSTFAAECQMGKLAEALGLDPVEFRMRNVLREGMLRPFGCPLPPHARADEALKQAATRGGWSKTAEGWRRQDAKRGPSRKARALRRGIGFACGFKNSGYSYGMQDESTATIELHGESEIETVVVRHIGAEIGQGHHTVVAQMAAEALGVALDKIHTYNSDTAEGPDAGMAGASRLTLMSGNAILGAARLALEKWKAEERPAIATFTYYSPKTEMFDPKTGQARPPSFAYGYVAQVVEIEVDTESGECHILSAISVNDVGKAIHPQSVEGQIEGSVSNGVGAALMEDLRQENGYLTTDRFSTYMIPTTLDMPDRMDPVILEQTDPVGPWGARGMSEMALVPFPSAVIAAIHDATGVWLDDYPATPERMLAALHRAQECQQSGR
jgi:CO/xanthine dehydrogenase Mo-binding subunit